MEVKDTRLFDAVERGATEEVRELLANGANVNARDVTGWTPLHVAAWMGHKEAALALLAGGAEVNAKNNNGWTALLYAALMGHKEAALALLAGGAEVKAKDNNGCTVLDLIKSANRHEVAALLENSQKPIVGRATAAEAKRSDQRKDGHSK